MGLFAEGLRLLWLGNWIVLAWRGLYFSAPRQSRAAQKAHKVHKNLMVRSSFVCKALENVGRGAAAGIASGKRVGRAFAHPFSLRFPEFSVKVVRHRIGKIFCGRLWKR